MVDPVIDYMKRKNIPLNREDYIALAYMDMIPDPWTDEDEESLPEEIRALE